MMQHHNYSLTELENMMPWEREIYLGLLMKYLEEEKKRINYEIKNDHDTIEMPIYYWEDEETKDKHYDFEEMADALEDRIHKYLKRNVLVTISELKNEWEDE